MKSKCSDDVYLKSKSLKEEEYDVKDRINTFYSRKRDLLNIIVEEKNNDPSKEIHEIEKEVKESDPFRGFIADNEEPMNKGTENKPCRYHSRGFCIRGLSCKFYHSSLDCRQHMEKGKCTLSECNERHREDCLFYKRKGGCTRSNYCSFLHRTNDKIIEEPDVNNKTNTKDLENIKQLEIVIKDMKIELQARDKDIIVKMKEIDVLKREVKEKEAEIGEKEHIIKKLEEEDSFSQDSDNVEEDQAKRNGCNESSESESEEELDLFQLEVVSGEEVYICNLCDEGLDSEAEIREHMRQKHKKVLKFY